MKTVLVTGAAGFIGFHLIKKLIKNAYKIVGIDNLNTYYDPTLKKFRLRELGIQFDNNTKFYKTSNFDFVVGDISNSKELESVFSSYTFDLVIHLAAQVGVRYSLENPEAYIQSNIVGFYNIIEKAKQQKVSHFIYASSSSVYGLNEKVPYSTSDNVDHPISLYAATKKSNELIAHTYSHLYDLPTTGLRFFTVYGPWGRPDMATFKFTKAILEGKPISVYNFGKMQRDFTYIDDIVESIARLATKPFYRDESRPISPAVSKAPYRVFNIGNHSPVNLLDFVHTLEKVIGKKAQIELMPLQPGDVLTTYADVDDLAEYVDFRPNTSIEQGLKNFVEWYVEFYKVTA
ncbi:NAD-dependent epimerase [Thermaurantimonas aggregans]|uniref:NAD-dependent epimerase n=1 Tax=Thermaurantimonas aggregans TaxID=2173829 RepID=A0A401XJY8_9FLAO|nr:NAD-dependent epimerase/dehydratase family protein [Thermaurantimonas aggregans]MCX8148569.1 NAD-dependent epimerase/dehydratase family protein [Thermaurantimonas aggregans]GCD77357.1 NAD-dependent epimerase [Thermaurantimonas aggregans]